jgi:hypothetical protein
VVQPVSGTVALSANTPTPAAGTNLSNDVGVQYRANATGAASVASVLSPATNAIAFAKVSAGRLLGWRFQNSAASLRSVKVFNLASGGTPGTTAAMFEIDITAGGTSEVNLEGGLAMTTGIGWMTTSAKGLTDNTGTVAANDVSGALFYA